MIMHLYFCLERAYPDPLYPDPTYPNPTFPDLTYPDTSDPDPVVTANMYCNFAFLYCGGCVICSIYLR